MEQQERLVSLNEAADRIAVNARTLQDRKYRERIGLVWVKIGQRVKFVEDRRQGSK